MAKNYTEILALANKNNMGLSNTIKRDYGIPLDYSSVQESYEKALEYAQSSTLAYIGQPISVGDVLYVVTTPENGYLKQVGVKPVGDEKSIEVSEEGVVSIYGFKAAGDATLPQKQADGTIKWVTVGAITKGDGNTKTVVKAADGSDITVTPVYDEVNDTYTYTLDVQFPAIPEYSVEKVEGENEVTYKVTKDGVQVGESIVVPDAFDPSEINGKIEVLEGVEESVKSYADGLIASEVERADGKYELAGAEERAKAYADGLADKYDAKGSAEQALVDAKAYADEIKSTILGDNTKLVDTYDTLEEIGNWINTHEGETVVNLTQAISDEEQARKDADDAIIERVVELEKVDHEHSNKDVLDGMTASFTSELLEKLNGIEEGANKYELPSDVVQDSKYSERMTAVETAVSTVDSRIEDAVEGVKDEVANGYLPVGGFVDKEYSGLTLSAEYVNPDAPEEAQIDEGYINLHASEVSITTPHDK